MRVGSVVYATDQGLGYLAKSFFDAGVVTDVAVVAHGRHTTHWDWYLPGSLRVMNLRRPSECEAMKGLCRRVDAMLFFETPFHWPLIDYCREIGVATFLMTMYECTPKVLPSTPDIFLCPSLLDSQYFPQERSTYLPVPVDPVPWRQRTKAEVFVHNAGHGGLKGRNGTRELLEAIPLVRSGAKFIVRSQEPIPHKPHPNLEVRIGTVPRSELYDEGDVFIFPEKFNGLSLPLQEAKASGMLVVAADRFPINTWLHREPRIPVREYRTTSIGPPYNEFQEAVIDPVDIARMVDSLYGKDITNISLHGQKWAETMSWEILKPQYLEEITKWTEKVKGGRG